MLYSVPHILNILGIYKVALTHKKLGITKELLANKVIPFLFPLCIDNGLNLTQVSSLTVHLSTSLHAECRAKVTCDLLILENLLMLCRMRIFMAEVGIFRWPPKLLFQLQFRFTCEPLSISGF